MKFIIGFIYLIIFLHVFVILEIDMKWLDIINKDNQNFNLSKIIEIIKGINKYLVGLTILIVSILIWIFNKNSINKIFYIVSIIYISILMKEVLKIFVNSQTYDFKVGEIAIILLFLLQFYILNELIKLFAFFRTDDELLESGFDRIPNTIQIIKRGFFVVLFILLVGSIFIYYLLQTPYSNLFIWIYFSVFSVCFLFIMINGIKVLQIRKHVQNNGYGSDYLALRKDIVFLPMKIFDQHEYQYSLLDIAEKPSCKIKENKLFKALNKILDYKVIDFKRLEQIVKSNQSKINDRNGIGWTPFMKYVADISLLNKNNQNKHNKSDDFKVLKILLDNGADININNYAIRSALNFAINYGDYKMVKFLVKNGADIIKKTNSPDIPIVRNDHIEQSLELREVKIYEFLKKKTYQT